MNTLLVLLICILECYLPVWIKPMHQQKASIREINDSLYFSNILHDRRGSGYYLVLNIDAPDYKGSVVIRNFLLYRFLHLSQNMTWVEYQSFMYPLLLRGDTLKTSTRIDEADTDGKTRKWAFSKVKFDSRVLYYSQLGEEAFLSHYFNRDGTTGTLREENNKDQRNEHEVENAIIEQLFQWRIYVSDQGVTGTLMYSFEGPPEQIRKQWLKEGDNK